MGTCSTLSLSEILETMSDIYFSLGSKYEQKNTKYNFSWGLIQMFIIRANLWKLILLINNKKCCYSTLYVKVTSYTGFFRVHLWHQHFTLTFSTFNVNIIILYWIFQHLTSCNCRPSEDWKRSRICGYKLLQAPVSKY